MLPPMLTPKAVLTKRFGLRPWQVLVKSWVAAIESAAPSLTFQPREVAPVGPSRSTVPW